MADREQILTFLQTVKDRGGTFEQARDFLIRRGLLQEGVSLKTPHLDTLRDRIEEAEKRGAMATVEISRSGDVKELPPDLEDEIFPSRTKFQLARDRALVQFPLTLFNSLVNAKVPPAMVADFAHKKLTGESVSDKIKRTVGSQSRWQQDVHEFIRMEEEEVTPEGLASKAGLQVLGMEIALDPLNLVPGLGGPELARKVFSPLSRRLLGKGFLSAEDFSRAFSEGLAEEVWEQTLRLGKSIQGEILREQFEQIGQTAGRAARKVYSDEISDVANDYFEALDQADIFERGQLDLGFVEKDPRLPFDDLSKPSSEISDRPLPAVRIARTESEKAARQEYRDLVQQREVLKDAVKGQTGQLSVLEQHLLKQAQAGVPIDSQTRVLMQNARDELARLEGQLKDVGGRIRKLPRVQEILYEERDSIVTGLDRTLAELNVMEDVSQDLIKRFGDDVFTRSSDDAIRERASLSAIKVLENRKVAPVIRDEARRAVEKATGVILASESAPSSNQARLLSRVMLDNLGAEAAAIAEKVPPAQTRSMSRLEHIVWRMLYTTFGGKRAELAEGVFRAAAHAFPKASRARKFLMDEMPEIYNRASGRIQSLVFDGQAIRGKLAREVVRASRRSGESVEKIGRQLTQARLGNDPSKIRDSQVRRAFTEAAKFLDDLGKRFIDEGLVDARGAETIKANMGEYIHYNYASFNVKDWGKIVRETAAWDDAWRWFKENYPKMTDQEIQGTMEWIVSKRARVRAGKPFQAQSMLPSNLPPQLLNELIPRKHMPGVLRELMGLNKNFLSNLDVTTALLARDLELTAMYREMLQKGLESGVIRVSPDIAGVAKAELQLDRLMGRVFYTTEDVANAFGALKSGFSPRGFLGMSNAVVKLGKIVASLETQIRNAFSIPLMWVANGTVIGFPLRLLTKADKRGLAGHTIAKKLFQHNVLRKQALTFTPEEQRILSVMYDEGILDTGISTGELAVWTTQFRKGMVGNPEEIAELALGKASGIAGRSWEVMLDTYRMTDNAGKAISFLRWRDILVGRTVDEFGAVTPYGRRYLKEVHGIEDARTVRDVEAAAAEYIKETIQHFPRVAPIARKLARFPLAGTFVSFPMEMMRNLKNIYKYAAKEFSFGSRNLDPTSLAIGSSLFAFPLVAAGGVKGIKALYRANGNGVDENTEELSRKYLLPPWSRNNDMFMEWTDDGKLRVLDISYNLPYTQLLNIANAGLFRPGDMSERALNVAQELEETLLGREIFLNAVMTAITGIEQSDPLLSSVVKLPERAKQLNTQDPRAHWERLYNFFKQIGPGSLVRLEKIATEAGADRGFGTVPKRYRWKEPNVLAQVAAFFGLPRVDEIDPETSMYFHFRSTMMDLGDSRSAFISNLRAQDDAAGRSAVVSEFRDRWDDLNKKLIDMSQAASYFGLSPETIQGLMDSQFQVKIKGRVRDRIISGEMVPLEDVYSIPEGLI